MREWKKIPSFPDYEVSNVGLVRKGKKVLNVHFSHDGYSKVTLKKNGKFYSKAIHPLVAEAFIGPRPKGYDCCHNNGLRNDNKVENLRWDTRRNNCLDAVKHGTTHKGERHPMRKLNAKQVLEIRERYKNGEGRRTIAKDFEIKPEHVNDIVAKRYWSHI